MPHPRSVLTSRSPILLALGALWAIGCPLEPFPIPSSNVVGCSGKDCDDQNPCTTDACVEGQCVHSPAPAGTSCTDEDLCDGEERCDGEGACIPGPPPPIDDGDPCTTDSCDPGTGAVTHAPNGGCSPWAPIAAALAPSPRERHTAVWTGTKMIVWGGLVTGSPSVSNTGGVYDPATDSWSAISTTGAPPPRHSHRAVWTGTTMIVWGGFGQTQLETTGGIYDPATDSWAPTSAVGAPPGRTDFSAVWTGTDMVVWGGAAAGVPKNDGARYDPATDTWTTLPNSILGPRYNHTAVWTGAAMLVWGGGNTFDWLSDGALYDPAADAWAGSTPALGAPSIREQHTAVWTDTSMLVWGGWNGGPFLGTGASLSPGGGAWATLPDTGAPSPRSRHVAVWTGSKMAIWSGCGGDGCNDLLNDGSLYSPLSNAWSTIEAATLSARKGASGVWSGAAMIVWGGRGQSGLLGDGAKLTVD